MASHWLLLLKSPVLPKELRWGLMLQVGVTLLSGIEGFDPGVLLQFFFSLISTTHTNAQKNLVPFHR